MIIVYLIEDPKQYMELYTSLKLACDDLKFSYNTLSRKDYPFEYNGYSFESKEPHKFVRNHTNFNIEKK